MDLVALFRDARRWRSLCVTGRDVTRVCSIISDREYRKRSLLREEARSGRDTVEFPGIVQLSRLLTREKDERESRFDVVARCCSRFVQNIYFRRERALGLVIS